jgi:diguanylate cyclase (GGDEF)-like protein
VQAVPRLPITRGTMSDVTRTRARNAAPFAAAAIAPYLLPLPGSSWATWPLFASVVLTLAVAAALLFGRWERWPDWSALGPALTYLLAVAVLREAGGGNSSGVGPMVLLPVIWLALHSTRRVLWIVLGAVPLVYWVPIVVEGGLRYPESGWRIGLLLTVLSATLGLTVQRLHDRVRAQAARLDELAHQDDLTHLPNRRAWLGQLTQALSRAERQGEPVSVAIIDIDRFKAVNDAGGHEAGDALLVHASRSWAGVLRTGDVLARMGGDEFALLLGACDAEEATEVLARMREVPLPATWSAGSAQWDGMEPADALLRRADALLYDAKRAGRDRILAGDQRPATLAT